VCANQSAKGGTRTPIALRLPDPKSGASASSATFAWGLRRFWTVPSKVQSCESQKGAAHFERCTLNCLDYSRGRICSVTPKWVGLQQLDHHNILRCSGSHATIWRFHGTNSRIPDRLVSRPVPLGTAVQRGAAAVPSCRSPRRHTGPAERSTPQSGDGGRLGAGNLPVVFNGWGWRLRVVRPGSASRLRVPELPGAGMAARRVSSRLAAAQKSERRCDAADRD
jgi:hypothetical protein